MPEVVVAVVVTWNRKGLLDACLRAIANQTRPVQRVIVVDNASVDGTREFLRVSWPDLDVQALPQNEGFGAGLAAGINRALESNPTWVWLFDDDSAPAEVCLERQLEVASAHPSAGAICIDDQREGSAEPTRSPSVAFRRKALIDGALVSATAIQAAGNVRADFFMMMEDYEFLSRLDSKGYKVACVAANWMQRLHVGGGSNPPWRGYYQARNHLRFALDRGDPAEVIFCLARQGKRIIHAWIHWDQPLRRTSLRLRGLGDAVIPRMGRVVDPASDRNRVGGTAVSEKASSEFVEERRRESSSESGSR